MIDAAVGHVADQLNQYLRRTFGMPEDPVVVSSLVEPDGTVAARAEDKLAVTLVNVERDASARRAEAGGGSSQRIIVRFPPLYLNLYLLVSANFRASKYEEALKSISRAVAFFQSRPVLDHSNSPELDPRIEKLVLEIENLSVHDLSNLWGVLGGRYAPSVLYKARMVAFDSSDVRGRTPTLRRPEPRLTP